MGLPIPRSVGDVERLARRVTHTAMTSVASVVGTGIESGVDALVGVIDLNALLAAVDLNALLQRVDMQRLLDQIDVDAIVQKVDLDALLQRIDVNGMLARIDLDTLVGETDVGAVIAKSTGSVASGAVDLVRRQGVGLDDAVARIAQRLRPRRLADVPPGPPGLIAGQGAT